MLRCSHARGIARVHGGPNETGILQYVFSHHRRDIGVSRQQSGMPRPRWLVPRLLLRSFGPALRWEHSLRLAADLERPNPIGHATARLLRSAPTDVLRMLWSRCDYRLCHLRPALHA